MILQVNTASTCAAMPAEVAGVSSAASQLQILKRDVKTCQMSTGYHLQKDRESCPHPASNNEDGKHVACVPLSQSTSGLQGKKDIGTTKPSVRS